MALRQDSVVEGCHGGDAAPVGGGKAETAKGGAGGEIKPSKPTAQCPHLLTRPCLLRANLLQCPHDSAPLQSSA